MFDGGGSGSDGSDGSGYSGYSAGSLYFNLSYLLLPTKIKSPRFQ